MNILGVELELDLYDADQLEVYERENRKVAETIGDHAQYEGKSTADAIRIQCRIIDRFFDAVFGEGMAKKIFQGKCNIRDHMEAFGIMAKAAEDSRLELDSIENKYTPGRAERRRAEQQNRRVQKQGSRNYYRNAAGKESHGH